MTKDTSLQLIIEGALMASEGPISLQDIANLFDENKPSKNEIKQVIENLNKSYKNNSFEMEILNPINIKKTEVPENDKKLITIQINQIIEDMVRRNPGQWIWTHGRWK